MTNPDLARFVGQLQEAVVTPEDAYRALEELSCALIGAKLFTVMLRNEEMGWSKRAYSSMPDAYPVSGTKPLNRTRWSRIVIDEKQTFVANDIESIATVFPDAELIKSLGCESVINVPIIIGGKVLGTINCLHESGFYTDEKVMVAEALKLPGAVCLLLNQHSAQGGE